MSSINAHLRPLFAAMALLAMAHTHAAERERTPPRVPATGAAEARVIVGYKTDAQALKRWPLSAQPTRSDVLDVMQRRADNLARAVGVPLETGRALSDRMHVLRASGLSSEALARKLAADPDIAFAVPDGRKRALMVPNDPLYTAGPTINLTLQTGGPVAGQWYLKAPAGEVKSSINATTAWDILPAAGSGVVVAVIDTGVLTDHTDLQGRLLPGYDFIADVPTANDGDGRDSDPNDAGDWITTAENARGTFANCGVEDSSWHGTKVAGIIGAATNNGIGIAGIAFGAQIRPVRVLGKCGGYDSDIIAGMLWAAGINQPGLAGSSPAARVLNMSLGSDGSCSAAYRDAVAQVNAAGAVVVAAAGNSAGRAVGTPANCPGMIAVAGLRHAGTKVGFSDLGPEITIAAPGGNCVNTTAGSACVYPIVTTTNAGTQRPLAGSSTYTNAFDIAVGTSFATPIVAGTVALILGAQPGLTPTEVKDLIQKTARAFPTSGADNGPDDPTPVSACVAPGTTDQLQCYCNTSLCGAGMLDAASAAQAAKGIFARIASSPASPQAGTAIQLSGTGTLLGAGRSVATWSWTLLNGGGVVSGFSGSTNASTASLQPTAAGTITVRLTVTDDLGRTSTADATLEVAAATTTGSGSGSSGGSGGGGTSSPGWLLGLLFAAGILRARHKRPA